MKRRIIMKTTLAMYVLLLTVLCSGCGNSQEASTEEKAVISEARTEAKEKTEEVTPETIYKEAIELQSGEKWQEAAILFGSLGDFNDVNTIIHLAGCL